MIEFGHWVEEPAFRGVLEIQWFLVPYQFFLGFFMAKKLYVGGLSYNTTEQSLSGLFGQAGNVDSVRIITDRDTGRSKGFGFVEMASDDEAMSAIERYNGQEFEGRRIVVNEARPQAPRSDRGGGSDRGGHSRGGNRW
jgi:RNA recognition motif-containing protein